MICDGVIYTDRFVSQTELVTSDLRNFLSGVKLHYIQACKGPPLNKQETDI
jgi:hypothetical protein